MAAVAANDVVHASEQERNERVANSLSVSITKYGPQVAFVGRTKSNIGWRNSFAGRCLRVPIDGLAAFYASRSDGGAIHRYGGSRGEQHQASRHENYVRGSFHLPAPVRSGLGPTS